MVFIGIFLPINVYLMIFDNFESTFPNASEKKSLPACNPILGRPGFEGLVVFSIGQ